MTSLSTAEELVFWERIDAMMAGDPQVQGEPLTRREAAYLRERCALALRIIDNASPQDCEDLVRGRQALRRAALAAGPYVR